MKDKERLRTLSALAKEENKGGNYEHAGDIRDTVLIIFYYENVETYRNIEIIVF